MFKQGTELVALQRDNLEMGNIAPQDISKQVPAWSILTSAYLFRDANHLNAFFASDLGAQMKKMVEDQVKVKILGPTFFGTRQVGLKPKKKITTPADLAGIKLRMPPGDAWQLLGRSLGANPTPMAYAETYTGLQTGAIDGQDNPLPNVQNMKFYEVMSQIVLTSHLVAFDLLTINLKTWQAMSPATAGQGAGRRRQGHRLERGRTHQARGRAGRGLPQAGPGGVRAEHHRLPRVRAEGLSGVGRGEELARRHGRQDQRHEVIAAAAGPAGAHPDTQSTGAPRCQNPILFARWPVGHTASPRRSLRCLLAVIFVAFIIQIVFRYAFNLPVGWTSDLAVAAWLWLVLWGAAFVLKDEDEIRFDLLSSAVGRARAHRHGHRRRRRHRRAVRACRCRPRTTT